jgi:hypothetical protein
MLQLKARECGLFFIPGSVCKGKVEMSGLGKVEMSAFAR